MPWVGRNYFENRVLLLGLNFDNWGGLEAHYWICESHEEEQLAGKRGKDGRPFGRGAMLYLRVVLNGLKQKPIPDENPAEISNEALGELWEYCAFLEAVKCAPGTERSNPTKTMMSNCPPFLLLKELEILRPSLILVFGRSQLRDVVRDLMVVPDGRFGQEQGPHLERDLASIGGRHVELISLNHPSSRGRAPGDSLSQLSKSIHRNGLGSPPLK